ncbi:hypothetical protein V8C35DRAFT_329550 [Trichoderma chlorosporum]
MNADSSHVEKSSIPFLIKDALPIVGRLKNTLQSQLQAVLLHEPGSDFALQDRLQDDGLDSEEKSKLQCFIHAQDIFQCMLPISNFLEENEKEEEVDDKLSSSIKKVAQSVHAGPDDLTELLSSDSVEESGIDANSLWGQLRQELFLEEASSAIVGMLQSKKILIPSELHESIINLFETAVQAFNFNIRQDPISKLFRMGQNLTDADENMPDVFKTNKSYSPALVECIMQLQQMLSLASECDDFQRLISCGYKTAEAIIGEGQKALETLMHSGLSNESARKVLNTASVVAIRNERLWIEAQRAQASGEQQLISRSYDTKDEKAVKQTTHGVNLSTIFSMENMREDDGISVTSPAAFFVYLLDSLKKVTLAESKGVKTTLQDKLFARRPDLKYLDLSLLNTKIEIPYIDLVNEILEAIALEESKSPRESLYPFNMRPEDDAKGAFSEPRHTRLIVYERYIQPMVFPMTVFPYNHATNSIRALLKACGVPLIQVLETFAAPERINCVVSRDSELARTRKTVTTRAWAAEILGLQHEDYVAIARAGFYPPEEGHGRGGPYRYYGDYLKSLDCREVWEYWGYKKNSDMTDEAGGLTKIQEQLLPRSGLTYENLLTITKSRYFGHILRITPSQPENMNQLRLEESRVGVLQPPGLETCQRINAFIRLWRKLPWTLHELDIFVSMFAGDGPIDVEVIGKLACVQKLAELTKFSLAEIQPLWGEIDTYDCPSLHLYSLYSTLFLRSAHADQVFSPRKVANKPDEYFYTDSNIEDHLPTLLEGVKLSVDEYHEIKDLIPTKLTLSSLTQLYRISTLCKMLSIPIKNYKLMIKLYSFASQLDPFRDPSTTLALVKEHKASLFSLDEQLFICTKNPIESADPYNPTKNNVAKIANAMIQGFSAMDHRDGKKQLPSSWEIVVEHLHPHFPGVDKEILEYILSASTSVQDKFLNSSLEMLLSSQMEPNSNGTLSLDIKIPTILKPTLVSHPHIIPLIETLARRLMRVAAIVRRCGIGKTEIEMLQDHKIALIGNDCPDLSQLRELERYCELLKAFPNNPKRRPLCDFYKSISASPPKTVRGLVSLLVSLSGWSSEVCLNYVKGKFAFNGNCDIQTGAEVIIERFRRLSTLVEMKDSISLAGKLQLPGISLEELFAMAEPKVPQIVRLPVPEYPKTDASDTSILPRPPPKFPPRPKPKPSIPRLPTHEPSVPPEASGMKWENDFKFEEALRSGIRRLRLPPGHGTAFEEVYNGIRIAQRSALAQYLLAHEYCKSKNVEDADSLFEYLLIDVKMGPKLQTSRHVQAISTVQLFVQRCLLGVEHGVTAPQLRNVKPKVDWDSVFRYRIWEAERKIFLHPENWVDPTLRDDKTEQFRELETAMVQTKLDSEAINELTKTYLHGVERVDNLEIVSYLWDRTGSKDGTSRYGDMHLFGRTRTQPVSFFYCQLQARPSEQQGSQDMYFWTPWEKLDVDVPVHETDTDGRRLDKPGSYIIPAMVQGQLTLFLPEITLVQKSENNFEPSKKKTGKDLLNEEMSLAPTRWWEVRMGRTERRNGKWLPKIVSPEAIECTGYYGLGWYYIPIPTITGFRFYLRDKTTKKHATEQLHIAVHHQGVMDSNGMVEMEVSYGVFEIHGRQLIRGAQKVEKVHKGRIKGVNFQKMTWRKGEEVDVSGILGNLKAPGRNGMPYSQVRQRIWTLSSDEAQGSPGIAALVFDDVAPRQEGHQQSILFPDATAVKSGKFKSVVFNSTNMLTPKLIDCVNSGGEVETIHEYLHGLDAQAADSSDIFGLLYFSGESSFHERCRPFSIYSWELGVHIPMLLAERLMATQQYELALETLRTVFDPAISDHPHECWLFPPFVYAAKGLKSRRDEPVLERTLMEQLEQNSVHVVARNYPEVYMKRIMLKYIETLVGMGDLLFRRATLESIPLAIERYVQASHLFGPRPVVIPSLVEPQPKTYETLRGKYNHFHGGKYDTILHTSPSGISVFKTHKLKPLGFAQSNYFSVPFNPYVIELGKKIDQRLHNIRNGLDINGIPMSLLLFERPIDPAAVLAMQALRSVGGSAGPFTSQDGPIPKYRFKYLIYQAYELVNELRLASQQLILIKEKRDAEAIWLLRTKHRRSILGLTMRIKQQQKLETEKGIEVLQETRKKLEMRLNHYLQLTGDTLTIPSGEGEQWADVSQNITTPTTDDLRMSPFELDEMNLSAKASDMNIAAGALDIAAAVAFALPTFSIKTQPMGMGSDVSLGGYMLGQIILAHAATARLTAQIYSDGAIKAARTGAITKQLQERRLEINSTGREIVKVDKEIKQLRVRLAVCDADMKAHEQEIENAAAEEEFLRTKYTNEQLYALLDNSMSVIFQQTYTMAADMAALARRALDFEHAARFNNDSKLPTIVNYWSNSQNGHLAAEAMYLDLKRLEKLHMESRTHDFEIKKNVSLRQSSPIELLRLRETGEATLKIPETLFDKDYPGHFCRRISSVSVSIPCILGAYTSVSCTLSLIEHEYRISNLAADGKAYREGSSEHFRKDQIPITSIAVSNGIQDSGAFSLNFGGTEEYGPFEGAGAISTWKIELPKTFRPFDYHTISDVVLHLQYTSINGGEQLKAAASQAAESFVSESGASALPIDLKHDFPSAWQSFSSTGLLRLNGLTKRLPFWTHGQNRSVEVSNIALYMFPQKPDSATVCIGESQIVLKDASGDALKQYALVKTDVNKPLEDEWTIGGIPKDKAYERGWLVIGYSAH